MFVIFWNITCIDCSLRDNEIRESLSIRWSIRPAPARGIERFSTLFIVLIEVHVNVLRFRGDLNLFASDHVQRPSTSGHVTSVVVVDMPGVLIENVLHFPLKNVLL